MKFTPDQPYSDPDTAAHKLLEITNAVEAVQDGRIQVKFTQADPDLFRLSKVPSVDQRMRLECGVAFANCGRAVAHVRGSYVPVKSGSRGRGLLDQIAGAAKRDGVSLWKSCFAETINIHLSLPLTATGYPFRYSEMGLNLKELGHRLPSFCISP